jgi:hypothetical protein
LIEPTAYGLDSGCGRDDAIHRHDFVDGIRIEIGNEEISCFVCRQTDRKVEAAAHREGYAEHMRCLRRRSAGGQQQQAAGHSKTNACHSKATAASTASERAGASQACIHGWFENVGLAIHWAS